MYWSFSEYLNLIDLRGQTWCVADLPDSSGFSVSAPEAILFYAVLDGRVKVNVGAVHREIKEGQAVFVTAGGPHSITVGQAPCAKDLQFLSRGEYVDSLIRLSVDKGAPTSRVLCGRLKPRWPGIRRPSHLPPVLDAGPLAQACVPLAEQNISGAGSVAVLTRMALMAFLEAFRADPSGRAAFQSSNMKEPIAKAVNLIGTHPQFDWTVEDLANKVGMSRSNFAARFVQETGMTPISALVSERMRLAADLLARTGLKVSEVAERVGYNSESSFSRRFTETYGETPGRRRLSRQARGSAAVALDG